MNSGIRRKGKKKRKRLSSEEEKRGWIDIRAKLVASHGDGKCHAEADFDALKQHCRDIWQISLFVCLKRKGRKGRYAQHKQHQHPLAPSQWRALWSIRKKQEMQFLVVLMMVAVSD